MNESRMTGERALEVALKAHAIAVDDWLAAVLPAADGPAAPLYAAMRYSALGGGKRVRAFLVKATADLFAVPSEQSLAVGAALELLHAYSLIHDDLPPMDDAATRRGKPACHRAFDEATAILAGDALQAVAFEILAGPDLAIADGTSRALVLGLARGAGPMGMCGGQMIDLRALDLGLDLAGTRQLQAMKTGALIRFACEAGCILGGAGADDRAALLAYGEKLGLAFQIADDLLDVRGDALAVGKDVGNDAGKATFVGLLGIAGAEAELKSLHTEASTLLDSFAERATLLRSLFGFVIDRAY
jgi:farnesyl diphosphate synthase